MVAVIALFVPSVATAAFASVEIDDNVWIGQRVGPSGLGMFPVYLQTPTDPANPGEPDYWAYCIEHDVHARAYRGGQVGGDDDFAGENYYQSDPTVPGKVRWILTYGYPALSLEEFASATNVPGLTEDQAITAMQTAIWAFTDLPFIPHDWASWYDNDDNVQNENWQQISDAYEYLIAGVEGSDGGITPEDLAVTASVLAPTDPQEAPSLVGPFIVQTNQPVATVTVDPAFALVDVGGNPVDADSVVDGQELYLDLRDSDAPGSATVSVSVDGASGTGLVLTVPLAAGETYPEDEYDHWQTLMLVAASTARTTAQASVQWSGTAPAIATTLTDSADADHVLPWKGGTVTDTIAYQNLTPGVEYRVSGELMRKSNGTATGIVGSVVFTPSESSGAVDVIFTIPEGHAGEYLVAFEELFETALEDEGPVAVHRDINDAAQTVFVEKAPVTTAGSNNTNTPGKLANTGAESGGFAAAGASALLLAGAVLLLARRRSHS